MFYGLLNSNIKDFIEQYDVCNTSLPAYAST